MENIFSLNELLYFILALPILFSVLAAANIMSLPILHWGDRLTATLTAIAAGLMIMQFDPE